MDATSPHGTTLAVDTAASAMEKVLLKGMRTRLNIAFLAVLALQVVHELQAKLTALFPSRLDAKTGRLYMSNTWILEKQ